MPIATDAANDYRDAEVSGVASAGAHQPAKSDIRALFATVDAAMTSLALGVTAGNAVAYDTLAHLTADLAHGAGVLGFVYADGTAANNGIYIKSGSSGSGSWAITALALPSTYAATLAAAIAAGTAAAGSQTAAASSATAAAGSATGTATSATGAATSATAAAASATAAAGSATTAGAAQSGATAQAVLAATAKAGADTSAATATAQAAIATTEAGVATAAAGSAAAAVTAANSAASTAGAQATNAANAAATATTEAGVAATQAGISTTEAGVATAAATSAIAAQAAAAGSVTAATGQATIAVGAAATATAEAAVATTQAGVATTQAGNAATSAAAGAASATTSGVYAGQAATAATTATNEAAISTAAAGVSTTQAGLAATAAAAASGSVTAAAAEVAAATAAAEASGPATFFDTYAAATAAIAGIADLGIVEIFADEGHAGARTRYRKQSGAYVFKVNLSDVAGMTFQRPEGGFPALSAARVMIERVSITQAMTDSQAADCRTGSSAIDCKPLLDAFQNTLARNAGSGYRGGPTLTFPMGQYKFGSAPQIHSALDMAGEGDGSLGGHASSEWLMASGVQGPTFNRYNTDSGGLLSPISYGSAGSKMRGIRITSAGGGDATTLGLSIRDNGVSIRDCGVWGFGGSGVYINADSAGGAATQGNANGYELDNVSVSGCGKYGVDIKGTDANAGVTRGLKIQNCGGGGLVDRSLLGSMHIGNQVAGCGTGLTRATYGGHNWLCLDPTNAPTTTPGSNPGVWYDLGAGSGFPTWVSGAQVWIIGSPYFANNPNSRSFFSACYTETGQPLDHVAFPNVMLGGQRGSGYTVGTGGTVHVYSNNAIQGALASSSGVSGTEYTAAGSEVGWNVIGGQNGNGTILRSGRADQGSNDWRLHWIGGEMVADWDGADSTRHLFITGPTTDLTFGRSAIEPYAVSFPRGLFLGDAANTSRALKGGTGAPGSGTGNAALGDVVLASNFSAGGKIGFGCVTGGVNGSTSVYKAFGVIDA